MLKDGKVVAMSQPRMTGGKDAAPHVCSILNPKKIEPRDGKYDFAVTHNGLKKHGVGVSLDDNLQIDVFILGSVAVNPRTGARIGKGEGFAELEYGCLCEMKALHPEILVITCVHDDQVTEDLPSERLKCHDLPADIICTPTRTIRVVERLPKPSGIIWEMLSPQKLAKVPVLVELKKRKESELGRMLPCAPDEVPAPLPVYGPKDLKTLNTHLAARKYVEGGDCATHMDFQQIAVVPASVGDKYPHVQRWSRHIRILLWHYQ